MKQDLRKLYDMGIEAITFGEDAIVLNINDECTSPTDLVAFAQEMGAHPDKVAVLPDGNNILLYIPWKEDEE